MHNRPLGFAALLAVIGVSIVFGMILGGKLNAPPVMFAAPESAPIVLSPASNGGGGGIAVDFADIVERALPAVVGVTSTQLKTERQAESGDRPFFNDPFFRRFFGDEEPEDPGERQPQPQQPRVGEGSGFIISPDGYILTNNHVVEDSDGVSVTLQDGIKYDARVVGTDPSIDLALLKVETGDVVFPTLALGDSAGLRVGEWVIAIGNPFDFAQTVTVGVVSGKGRRLPLRSTDFAVVSFIQTDAAINFGNSGGPLLDARGNVVGINTAINRQYMAEGIGFALPINQARAVVEQLRERGYVKRGFIGITMNQAGLDAEARDFYGLPDTKGVIIREVQEDGPGRRAGLEAGDVIRKVDGSIVENNFDLVSKIASHQPGDRVALEIYRKKSDSHRGKTVTLDVTLADRNEGLEARLGEGRRRPEPDPEPEIREIKGLGLTLENLTPRMRERLALDADEAGLLVTDVEYGSAAFEKGLQANMVITGINDEQVGTLSDWTRLLERRKPGSSIKLNVRFGSQAMYFFMRVPDAPE